MSFPCLPLPFINLEKSLEIREKIGDISGMGISMGEDYQTPLQNIDPELKTIFENCLNHD